MRILVMSDCHGSKRAVETVLSRHEDINNVFYLGDGVEEFLQVTEFFKNKNYYIVSGNCDWNSMYPTYGETVLDGVTVIYTHGHLYGVKYGTEKLYEAAVTCKAKLVLYGHTHIADSKYRDGVYIVNPGALRASRDGKEGYAIVDINQKGIVTSLMKL